MSTSERSLFITLSARAASSVGFSVSILAWLWLTFGLPVSKTIEEPVLIDKKARRRSAPAALPSHKPHKSHKRSSLSPPLRTESPVLPDSSSLSSPARTRRVYFVDSPTTPSRSTIPLERPQFTNDSSERLHASPVSETSPASSCSTLVHPTYTSISPQTLETCRESAIESDSSNSSRRPSLSLSTRALRKTRRGSGTAAVVDSSPVLSPPPPETPRVRRSSISFIPPWSLIRRNAPVAAVAPSTSTSTASPATAIVSPSYFSRKNTRRVSTPVPRTQPYAHPYYAQPPVEDEVYSAYLRGLPQFGGAEAATSPTASDSEDKEKDSSPLSDRRGRNRKVNDLAQAALGLGRTPPRPRLKTQRSASESWADRKGPRH
ncbi:hypothetical protein C8J57DRAFT_1268061 [Mycena rebaudengoi]|nr:hypothetical protein C8J57DRAFT_1268061 [Mycena rebaudengoi]